MMLIPSFPLGNEFVICKVCHSETIAVLCKLCLCNDTVNDCNDTVNECNDTVNDCNDTVNDCNDTVNECNETKMTVHLASCLETEREIYAS